MQSLSCNREVVRLIDDEADRRAADPEQLARRLGVTVAKRALPPWLDGFVESERRSIVLRAELSEPWRRFTLLHELAHVLVGDGRMVHPGLDEERAADFWAARRLAPQPVAAHPDGVAVEFGIPTVVAAWRLADLQRTAQVQHVLGHIVCKTCGWRRRSITCACRIEDSRRRDADYRQPTSHRGPQSVRGRAS